jgi:hypothetical protein
MVKTRKLQLSDSVCAEKADDAECGEFAVSKGGAKRRVWKLYATSRSARQCSLHSATPMKRRILIAVAAALLAGSLSCSYPYFSQKTVYEPGEPEHGGVILHGPDRAATTP